MASADEIFGSMDKHAFFEPGGVCQVRVTRDIGGRGAYTTFETVLDTNGFLFTKKLHFS